MATIAVTLQEVAKLTEVVIDKTAVRPGGLVVASLIPPLPGDSPALGDSAFSIDVQWRVVDRKPSVDADGFVVEVVDVFVTPNATPANLTTVTLAVGDGAKLSIPAGGQLFLVWWNVTDYTDPALDPDAEIVEVKTIGPSAGPPVLLVGQIEIVRASLGSVDKAHDAGGKTYRMRKVPPFVATATATVEKVGNIALAASHGERLPAATPTNPFMAIWWNATDFADPSLDPAAEIVKVTNRAVDALTVKRGQRGTRDIAHATATKIYKLRVLQPQIGYDFIAPGGLDKLSSSFGFMPLFSTDATPPPPKSFWLIADLTLRRAGAGAVSTLILRASKASPEVLAQGLSKPEITNQLLKLFKIEIPTVPVAPGVPLTARLKPTGAEDAEWDVESATEVVPRFDLVGKVQVDALFQPLGRIANSLLTPLNKILASGVRLLTPVVRILSFVGRAAEFFAGGIGGLVGKKNPLRGLNVVREIERLLRRLRIGDIAIFKDLEVPVDANIVNRNFTTNLVPHNAMPPLPGPSKLLPRVPTLEQQIETMDKLPVPVSVLPIAGSLNIPISLDAVTWELWRNEVTLAAAAAIGATQISLPAGHGSKLPQTAPFGLIIWNDAVSPGNPVADIGFEVVHVTAKTLDSLTVQSALAKAHAIGDRMRIWPSGQLIAGPPVVPSSLTSPLPEVSAPAVVAGPADAISVALPPSELAKLVKATPYFMVWFNGAGEPYADPNAEIVQVNYVGTNAVDILRAQKGTRKTNHNDGHKLRVLADYFELAPTAGRNLVKTFAIEPPLQPDLSINLDVTVDTIVDPANVALPLPIELPSLPIRLLGFDPLAFAAQQMELLAPTEPLEPCEEAPIQVSSAIPIQVSTPSSLQIPLSLGVLPVRVLEVSVTWELLDENNVALTPGIQYSLSGLNALTRSIFFVPELTIMRREEPSASLRHVRVRLSTTNPPLQQVLGPLTIPVLPLQVPLFIAAFKYRFFIEPVQEELDIESAGSKGKEHVVVFMPDYYVTQAPEWVDSWEAFQSKINDIQARLVRLLAVAGGYTPLALPGEPSLDSTANVRLSLIRGALDYVANRAASGKLEFLRSVDIWATNEFLYSASPSDEGISYEHMKNAHTLIIANDDETILRLHREDTDAWDQTVVGGHQGSPICILWRNFPWQFGDVWDLFWIPIAPSWGDSTQTVTISEFSLDKWHIHTISARFDQFLFANKYFPTPADLFSPPPSS